jgi:hypothetical protein
VRQVVMGGRFPSCSSRPEFIMSRQVSQLVTLIAIYETGDEKGAETISEGLTHLLVDIPSSTPSALSLYKRALMFFQSPKHQL